MKTCVSIINWLWVHMWVYILLNHTCEFFWGGGQQSLHISLCVYESGLCLSGYWYLFLSLPLPLFLCHTLSASICFSPYLCSELSHTNPKYIFYYSLHILKSFVCPALHLKCKGTEYSTAPPKSHFHFIVPSPSPFI